MQMVHYCRSEGASLQLHPPPFIYNDSIFFPKQLFLLVHVPSDFYLFLVERVCVGDCCGSVAMVTVELEAEAATVAEVGAVA